ncbi:MAG: helix-turn-helix transcriptional regulator [Lachnospiraceae bacterium]|nr:helix-turn-helix transcriptional regulator [Lachnospiraceae bacterium]
MNKDFFTDQKNSVVRSNRILYTPSAFAKNSLLYLQEIGELQARQAHTSKRQDLDSFLVLVVTEGAGTLVYNNSTYRLEKGDCAFINCASSYSHTTEEDALWSLSWIHFNGNSMPQVYEKYKSRGGRPVFHPVEPERFLALHDRIFRLADSNDYIKDMKINSGLSELLVLLMAESWNPDEAGKRSRSLANLKEYLDAHYTEKISLDHLAELFYINKFYMTRVFKEQYGVSINTYLQQLKITKAKQMLRFTENTVEEIGMKCGIGEANYFSRLFKQVEGITPSAYRRQWKTGN